jgi:mono/diheme cytochrome c family protein
MIESLSSNTLRRVGWATVFLACAFAWLSVQGTAQQSHRTNGHRTPTDHTTGNIEHGRYIVENIAMCGECHSPRNEKGEIIADQRFMGAPIPVQPPPWPNDWALRAPRNRTLPGYTDELAIRLLTQGAIDRNGKQLRPPMPRFRMTRQDAADVVAYLKSLQ